MNGIYVFQVTQDFLNILEHSCWPYRNYTWNDL